MTAVAPVTALASRAGTTGVAVALRGLWNSVDDRGWLDVDAPRVVVEVGRTWHTPLVAETVRSLVDVLATLRPDVPVQVADGSADEIVHVAGVATADVAVPAAWFEPFFLITVAGAGPDGVGRIHGALAAQAEQLRRLGNPWSPPSLAYEAHRLGRSDLVVLCGTASRNDARSEPWWIASPSDVGADVALARACGVAPERLGFLRAVARRELLPRVDVVGQTLPPLRGYAAPRLGVSVRAAVGAVAASGSAAAHDARTIRRNLSKIPNFVRRQLAARRNAS